MKVVRTGGWWYKRNGSARICVDLTTLNQAVCRERHLIHSVKQSPLLKMKVFLKINANTRVLVDQVG